MTPDAQRIADIYAEALLGLSWEQGQAEQVADQLDALAEMLAEMPDVRDVLRVMSFNPHESRQFVERTFRGRVDDRVADFIGVLARHGRLGLLSILPARFRQRLDRRKQKLPVTVTTAIPLEASQRETLIAALSESLGREVVLQTEVDRDLIGGLQVRVGDRVYDATLAGAVDEIRERLKRRGAGYGRAGTGRGGQARGEQEPG